MLGDPEGWPATLKMVVQLMLTASQPIHVFWSADAICLFNDAARCLFGVEANSASVGLPAHETLNGARPRLGLFIEKVLSPGECVFQEDAFLIEGDGRWDEQFWTYRLNPSVDEGVEGVEEVGGVLPV